MKAIPLILLFLIFSFRLFSQTDSCNLRISLLTCGPGEELYSIFGHSALRVTDNQSGTDIIYNYGTFDFDDPDFYAKFIKGNLLYFVSTEKFVNFIYSYQLENRSVAEQLLQLTCSEKKRLFQGLQINALEQNKYYHYNFIFDNCSTRLRDIVSRHTDDSLQFKNILPAITPSFRDMLHEYINKGKKYWSGFGIDLLLGSRADRKPTNSQAMFLPDYLLKGFDSAYTGDKTMVSEKKILFAPATVENEESFFTPIATTTLLMIIAGLLSFIKRKAAQNILNVFDVTFFFILGMLGCILVFMWLGTGHDLFGNNYNLLWALPTHLPISFILLSKKKLIGEYFKINAMICLVLIISWAFLPQAINAAVLPIIVLSGIRSAFRAFKK